MADFTFDPFNDGDGGLEDFTRGLLDHSWIPAINEIARTMKGKPKAEVFAALQAANNATVQINDEELEKWATDISKGFDFELAV